MDILFCLKKGEPNKDIPQSVIDEVVNRFDATRYSNGSNPTAELRSKMQKVMQNHCAVFRDEEIMSEGKKLIEETLSKKENNR